MTNPYGSRRVLGLLGAAACFTLATAWSGAAHADGGIPRGYEILAEPGKPSHILLHSQYWGLFDQRSDPANWTLLCSQAFGGRALDPDNYPTVMAQGGRILVASNFNGLIVSDDTCTWKQINAFNDEPVQVIGRADSAGKNFIAITVKGESVGGDGGFAVNSRVYPSADRGDTWTAAKGKIDTNISMNGVAVAPSDPKRIYAVGVKINSGPRMISVSKDGGDTFTSLPVGAINTDYDPSTISPLTVVGIAPDNPDTLFVRADGPDSFGSMVPDELWVSSDAGKTWKKAYTPMMDLPGFAFTPDGKSVLIAGPTEGIKKAALADAVAGKADAFKQVYMGQVWGIAYIDGKLYAGNDDYAMKPPFMLGVSTDDGMTFTKQMGHCDVAFPTCSMDSNMEKVCREQWTRYGGYITDYLSTCNGGAAGAAGAPATNGGAPSSGGGTTGSSSSGGSTSNNGTGGGTANNGTGGAAAASTGGSTSGGSSSGCSVGSGRADASVLAGMLVAIAALGGRVARRRAKRSTRDA